jgi:hypothetical protein
MIRRKVVARVSKWDSLGKQREFFDQLAKQFDVKHYEDWYDTSAKNILKTKAAMILRGRYQSVAEMLFTIYPEHPWNILKFKRLPRNFWIHQPNQRLILDSIAKNHGFLTAYDWIKSKENLRTIIIHNQAEPLLRHHKTLPKLLEAVYPEHTWNWDEYFDTHNVPLNYWKDPKHHRTELERFAQQHNFSSWKDWYSVTRRELAGLSISKYYKSSIEMLETNFPEHKWEILDFQRLPRNFWKSKENQVHFMTRLMQKLGFSSPKQFAHLGTKEFVQHGGCYLLRQYSSFYEMLSSLFPHEEWLESDFIGVPRNFWKSKENQALGFKQIESRLGITCLDDWNSVGVLDFCANGGRSLMMIYGSLPKVLETFHPEHNWDPFSRPLLGKHYWQDSKNIVEFMKKLEVQFAIKSKEDWYRVSMKQIRRLGGYGIANLTDFVAALHVAYPDETWDEQAFQANNKRSSQRQLFVLASQIFSDYEVIEEYYHDILSRESGLAVEFDVFVPQLNLALEYHGEHHYGDIPALGHLEAYKVRDAEKAMLCELHSITLVVVPYWWDESVDQLQSFLNPYLSKKLE